MKYKFKYFGTKEELTERLLASGADLTKCSVRSYALDNEVELDVTEREYLDVCDALGDALYSEENVSLSRVLVDFLAENDLVIATAESCTGGLVAARIVDAPGASKVFHEGLVTYSNAAKEDRLNVSAETLEKYGAVSEQVAKEMAYGLLSENVDIAVSTTGVAGPDGGTPEKPVGLVYIGIAFRSSDPIAFECRFSGSRNDIRRCAANEALYRAYMYLYSTL